MILSTGQKAVLTELIPIAKLALKAEKQTFPISYRTHSLVCGPSGSGKSFLMHKLADILQVPILFLNVANWTPVGGKGEPTWIVIKEFIDENPKGIIVLDEIDKIGSENSEWIGHVRLEIFDLLDARIPSSINVDDEW